jgi:hypothetical protein
VDLIIVDKQTHHFDAVAFALAYFHLQDQKKMAHRLVDDSSGILQKDFLN